MYALCQTTRLKLKFNSMLNHHSRHEEPIDKQYILSKLTIRECKSSENAFKLQLFQSHSVITLCKMILHCTVTCCQSLCCRIFVSLCVSCLPVRQGASRHINSKPIRERYKNYKKKCERMFFGHTPRTPIHKSQERPTATFFLNQP